MVVQFKKFNVKSNLELYGTQISFDEAQTLIGLSYITFYANFRKDNIPHERPTGSRKITFLKQDILDYMERHKVGDWSDVTKEDILFDEKVDMKEACRILCIRSYDTFYSIMRNKNLPRFQYNTKIVFCKSLILKYKTSCKRTEWSRENA